MREFRILRKEAVTGVDGIGAGARGDVENLRNIQIRFRRCGRADGIGFIGFAHVERGAVYIGVDDHGGNVQLVAGSTRTAISPRLAMRIFLNIWADIYRTSHAQTYHSSGESQRVPY